MFCSLKHALGKPGEGVHAPRILAGFGKGFARNDVIATLLGGLVLAKLTKTGVVKTIVALFGLATFLHWLFCVDTAFLRLLS